MINKKVGLFIILIFFSIIIFLGFNLIKLQNDIDLLNSKIMSLESQYNGAVENAKYQIEEVIKEKESMVSSYSLEPTSGKIENESIKFRLKIIPRVYQDGMSAECVISGKDTNKYNLNYKNREYTTEIPININEEDIKVTVFFNNGKTVNSQELEISPNIIKNNIMKVDYEGKFNFKVSNSNDKLIIAGDLTTIYNPTYSSDKDTTPISYPESGVIILKQNGTKILEKDIEFNDISDGRYSGCEIYTTVKTTLENYKQGDTVEVFAKVIDNFGNITEEKIDTFK